MDAADQVTEGLRPCHGHARLPPRWARPGRAPPRGGPAEPGGVVSRQGPGRWRTQTGPPGTRRHWSVVVGLGSVGLERVRRVLPRLATVDLEARAHVWVGIDADDLVALGALPALESVGRALEEHAGATLVAHLALQRAGASALAREVGAHVVSSTHPRSEPGRTTRMAQLRPSCTC